jgi:hypothetical protein
MRLVHRVSLAAALLAGSFVAIVSAPLVSAQDATPAADCAVTTPEENVAIVTAYVTAYDTVDQATLDETLADEYVDNLDRGDTPHDTTTNDDEHSLAQGFEASFPGSTYIINEIVALDDSRVVADLTISITHAADPATGETVELPETVLVPSMSIVTVECGEIASARTVSDGLALIVGLGLEISLPAATPEA